MANVVDYRLVGFDSQAYAKGCKQLQAWHEECRRRRIAKKIRERKTKAALSAGGAK